jgi:hypothetical protein
VRRAWGSAAPLSSGGLCAPLISTSAARGRTSRPAPAGTYFFFTALFKIWRAHFEKSKPSARAAFLYLLNSSDVHLNALIIFLTSPLGSAGLPIRLVFLLGIRLRPFTNRGLNRAARGVHRRKPMPSAMLSILCPHHEIC